MDEFGWQYVRIQRTDLYISQISSCLHPQLHCQPDRQPYMGKQLPAPSPFFQMQPRWTRDFKIHLKPSVPLYKLATIDYNRPTIGLQFEEVQKKCISFLNLTPAQNVH